MKSINYDRGWQFNLIGKPSVKVDLPHDFDRCQPIIPDSRMGSTGGWAQGGDAVYRKKLTVNSAWKKVILEVEGAYMNSEVYINGSQAAFRPYGYTSYHADLTKYLKYDTDNELEVRVNNNAQPNSRWYSGSGLYRHVYLLTGEDTYIKPWGVAIKTVPLALKSKSISGGVDTEIIVDTDIASNGAGTVRHIVLDKSGSEVGRITGVFSGTEQSRVKAVLSDIKLWSIDTPVMYTLRTELISECGQTADTIETKFGVRKIALSPEDGFLFNGRPIKMKGGCVHHDCGILGSAAFDDAELRKVRLLKEAGFNAIRCAHNPPSPTFLDACDNLGVLVIDEAFDCFRMGKNNYDYHLYFDKWWKDDIKSMVRRDRNHPCVVLWSTGNEIFEMFGRTDGYRVARELAEAVRKEDDTRFVTNALCEAWWQKIGDWADDSADFAEPLDVAGYNYMWFRYKNDLKKFPKRLICGTETMAKDAYDTWNAAMHNPQVIGDFVWTSMDYLGESGIGHYYRECEPHKRGGLAPFPWHHATCGDIDLCGYPRPQSYYRQVMWGKRLTPYIGVMRPNRFGEKLLLSAWAWNDVIDSWSFKASDEKLYGCRDGCASEPEVDAKGFIHFNTDIEVYSHCDEVELIVNGKSLGKKPCGFNNRFIAVYENVRYEPGYVEAIGYINGRVTGRTRIDTCCEPEAIELTAENAAISSVYGSLAYINVVLNDSEGNRSVFADNQLHFELTGPAKLLAVGSSNYNTEEMYIGDTRKAFEGRALCVICADGVVGEAILTVSAEGLNPAQVRIRLL